MKSPRWVRHGTGTFVGQLSLRPLVEGMVFRGVLIPGVENAMLREIIDVRRAMDESLAPRIIERLAGQDATDLRACVDGMKRSAAAHVAFPDDDREFHLLMAERLGNALYGQLVAAFWDIHMTVAPTLGVSGHREIDETAAAHERLLDTALAGDLQGYLDAVRAHYEPINRVLASASDRAG